MQPGARHPLWGGGSRSTPSTATQPQQTNRPANSVQQQQGTPATARSWPQPATPGDAPHAVRAPAMPAVAASPAGPGPLTPQARNSTPGAAAAGGDSISKARIEQLRKKQLVSRINVALLEACYNAVLAHQELVQQGAPAGPFPMFPMEKLAEGYRNTHGCEPDLPLLGCMSMKQLLMHKEFSEHVKVMEQPIRDAMGRPHSMVQPLKQYTDLDTIKIIRGTKLELLREINNQLQQAEHTAARRAQQQQAFSPLDRAASTGSGSLKSAPNSAAGAQLLRRHSSQGSGHQQQQQHAANESIAPDAATPHSVQRAAQQQARGQPNGGMGQMQPPMQQQKRQNVGMMAQQPGMAAGPNMHMAQNGMGMTGGVIGMQGMLPQQQQQQMMMMQQQQRQQQMLQQQRLMQEQQQQQMQPQQQQPKKKKKKQDAKQKQPAANAAVDGPVAAASAALGPAAGSGGTADSGAAAAALTESAGVGGEGQPDMSLPVLESVAKAIYNLKAVLAFRTGGAEAKQPYYLDQVYSDFELKFGHRLDPKVLGYESLAELVTKGTAAALKITLQPDPSGGPRIRVVREKPQQSLDPAQGLAGLHGKKRPADQDATRGPAQAPKRPLPFAGGLGAAAPTIPGLSNTKAPAIPGLATVGSGGTANAAAAGPGGAGSGQQDGGKPEVVSAAAADSDAPTAERLQQQGFDPCVAYVTRLPHDTTREELLNFFSPVGGILHARLGVGKNGQQHAFIQFSSFQEAQDAIHYKHNALFRGHMICVMPAKRRQPKPTPQQQQAQTDSAADADQAPTAALPMQDSTETAAAQQKAPASDALSSHETLGPLAAVAATTDSACAGQLQLGPGLQQQPSSGPAAVVPLPGTLFTSSGISIDPSTQVVMIVSGPPPAAAMQQQQPLGPHPVQPQLLPGMQQQPHLAPGQQQQQLLPSVPPGAVMPVCVGPGGAGMAPTAGTVLQHRPMVRLGGPRPMQRIGQQQQQQQWHQPPPHAYANQAVILGEAGGIPRAADAAAAAAVPQLPPTYAAVAADGEVLVPFAAAEAPSQPVATAAAGGDSSSMLPNGIDMDMLQAVVSLAAASAAGPASTEHQQVLQQQQHTVPTMGPPSSTGNWQTVGATGHAAVAAPAWVVDAASAHTGAVAQAVQSSGTSLGGAAAEAIATAGQPAIATPPASSGPDSTEQQIQQLFDREEEQPQQQQQGPPSQQLQTHLQQRPSCDGTQQQQQQQQQQQDEMQNQLQQHQQQHFTPWEAEGSHGQLKLPAWMQPQQQQQGPPSQDKQQTPQQPVPQAAEQHQQQQVMPQDQALHEQQWHQWQQQQQQGQQAWRNLQQQQQAPQLTPQQQYGAVPNAMAATTTAAQQPNMYDTTAAAAGPAALVPAAIPGQQQDPVWQPPLPPGAPPPAAEAGHAAAVVQAPAAAPPPAAMYQQQPAQQWPQQQEAWPQQQQPIQPDARYAYQQPQQQQPGVYGQGMGAPESQQQLWYQQHPQQYYQQQQQLPYPPPAASTGYDAQQGYAAYHQYMQHQQYPHQQYPHQQPHMQQPVPQQQYGPYGQLADPNAALDPQSLQQLASWGVIK